MGWVDPPVRSRLLYATRSLRISLSERILIDWRSLSGDMLAAASIAAKEVELDRARASKVRVEEVDAAVAHMVAWRNKVSNGSVVKYGEKVALVSSVKVTQHRVLTVREVRLTYADGDENSNWVHKTALTCPTGEEIDTFKQGMLHLRQFEAERQAEKLRQLEAKKQEQARARAREIQEAKDRRRAKFAEQAARIEKARLAAEQEERERRAAEEEAMRIAVEEAKIARAEADQDKQRQFVMEQANILAEMDVCEDPFLIPEIFAGASPELRADFEVAMTAVSRNGTALAHASEAMRSNDDIVRAACQDYPDALQWATLTATLKVVVQHVQLLRRASTKLLSDPSFMLDVIEQTAPSGEALDFLPRKLSIDRIFMKRAMKRNPDALTYISDDLRDDVEVVLEAVTQKGMMLKYASERLRANTRLVKAACKHTGGALKFGGLSCRKNRDVVIEAVSQDGTALKHADSLMQSDKGVCIAACKQNGRALQHASKLLKADKDVVMLAVENEPQGKALRHAATNLKVDPDVVYAAEKCVALHKVAEDPDALGGNEVAAKMRNDVDVVLAAAKVDVDALDYAAAELKANPDMIIAAVRTSGDALFYAADELKADRQFVLDCVAIAPDAIEYADESLRLDKGFLLAAMNSSSSFRDRASRKGVATASFRVSNRQKQKLAALATFKQGAGGSGGTFAPR